MPRVTRTCILTAKTNTDSCSVKSRRRETPGIERTATLSDKEGKGSKSVRVPKVSSSQRARSVAERSRCGSRIALVSSLQIGSTLVPISKATNILSLSIAWKGRLEENLIAKRLGITLHSFECLHYHRQKQLFLYAYVDDINIAGRKKPA